MTDGFHLVKTSTLRHQIFAQRAFITHEGRKPLLKLATAMQKREWITGLCDQSTQFDLPVHFTTQLLLMRVRCSVRHCPMRVV